jgi:hypothetical protein
MTTTFTPAGTSAAAAVYSNNDLSPRPDAVALSQSGRARRETGKCTFPTEATTCFVGLTPGQPTTVEVLQAPKANVAVLGLAWP